MNSLFDQLAKIWTELSAAQRLTISAALLAVVVGMTALVYYSSKPQMRLLYGGIDTKEMSQVVASLDEQKIPYEIGSGGRSVFVPAEKVYQMRMKLAAEGIPSGGGVGYEIFDKGNFGISDFVQRTNYVRALQGELSRTIGQLQGVRSARVMIVMPENKLLVSSDHARPTASVFVDIGGQTFGEENVNAIRYLVANSIEGLKTTDVAVIDSKGKMLSSAAEEENVFGAAVGHFKFRKAAEDYLTQKVYTMLAPVVGTDNVVVRVSVDLDFNAQTQVDEKYDPEGQVVRSQTINEDSSSSTDSSPGAAVVGASANTPGDSAAGGASVAQSSNSNSKRNRSTSYEINKSIVETVRSPGSIRSVSAAIFLARQTEKGATTAAPITRTPQELETIRRMVINALGLESGDEAAKRITVEEMNFAQAEAAPAKPSAIDAVQSGAADWLEMGRKLLAIGVAVAIFWVFLGMLKKQKTEQVSFEVIDEKPTAATQAQLAITPEVLNELIQQKPDNVSAALKSWVNAGNSKR
jgi:flagellar M-ring protein FliF